MQPNSELRDYVIMARRTGHSDIEIRQVLLNAGWNALLVQEAFMALQTPPAPLPTPGMQPVSPVSPGVQMPVIQNQNPTFVPQGMGMPTGPAQPLFMPGQAPVTRKAPREMPQFVKQALGTLQKLLSIKILAGIAAAILFVVMITTSFFGLLKKTSIEVDGFHVDINESWQLESGTEAVGGLLYKSKQKKNGSASQEAQLGIFTTAGSVSRADLTLKAFESKGTLDVLFDDTGSTGKTNSTYRVLEYLYNDKTSQQVTRVKMLEIVATNTLTVEYRIPDGLWEEYSAAIDRSFEKTIAKN